MIQDTYNIEPEGKNIFQLESIYREKFIEWYDETKAKAFKFFMLNIYDECSISKNKIAAKSSYKHYV